MIFRDRTTGTSFCCMAKLTVESTTHSTARGKQVSEQPMVQAVMIFVASVGCSTAEPFVDESGMP